MNDLHILILDIKASLSLSNSSFIFLGTNFEVVHISQLDTTALDALILRPFLHLTPEALPSSINTCSTCVRRSILPPFFTIPRSNAAAIAPLPPLGKSMTALGL